MSDFLTEPPEQRTSVQQQRQQQQRQQAATAAPDLYSTYDAAFTGTPTSNLVRDLYGLSQFPADPNFRLDENLLKKLTADIGPQYMDQFAYVKSDEEAAYVLMGINQTIKAKQTLARAGWTGTALSIGANLIDPVYLTAGALTGPLLQAGRVATVAALARNGFVAALPFAGIALYQQSHDPEITNADVLKEGASGFFFQVGLSRFASSPRYVRALAGATGMALPGVAINIYNGQSAADTSTIGAAALGGLFGVMSRRDMGKLLPAMKREMQTRAIDMNKDAAVRKLLLPPGRSESTIIAPGKIAEPFTGTLPEVLTVEGYQFFKTQLSDAEQLTYKLMSGIGDVPPALLADLKAKNGPNFSAQLRSVYSEMIAGGKTPMQSLRDLSHGFANYEIQLKPGDGSIVIGKTRLSGSYTARVAAIMDGSFDDGIGETFARLNQFDHHPHVPETGPITPIGTEPAGARLSPKAAASVAEDAPIHVEPNYAGPPVDPDLLARFTRPEPLGDRLNIPRPGIGKPFEKMNSEELATIARAHDIRANQTRQNILRELRNKGIKPATETPVEAPKPVSRSDRLQAWAGQVEKDARARIRARQIERLKSVRSGIDPLELAKDIADMTAWIVAKVIRHGPTGVAKLDKIARHLISNRHPHLMPNADKIIADARTFIAATQSSNGTKPAAGATATAPSQHGATVPPSSTAPPPSQRGPTGFHPNMDDTPKSWLGDNMLPFKEHYLPFTATLGGSENPHVRTLGRNATLDPHPRRRADGSFMPVQNGAVQWAQDMHVIAISEHNIAMDHAYAAHIKEAAASRTAPLSRHEFHLAVTRAMRRPNDPSITPSLRQGALAASDTFRVTLEAMKNHGVKGANGVQHDAGYVPRKYDETLTNQLVHKHGKPALEQMIYDSIIPNGRTSEKVRREIANAIAEHAMGYGKFDNSFLHMDPETLFARIKAKNPGISVADIQELRDVLLPGIDKAVGAKSLKNRVLMDETKVHILPDGTKATIEDFLENDIDTLVHAYTREGYGSSAQQAIVTDFGAKVGRDFTSLDDIFTFIENDAINQPHQPQEVRNKDRQYLETAMKMVRGQPIHATDTKTAAVARMIGQMNFFQRMSNLASGVTNITEISQVLSHFGFEASGAVAAEVKRVVAELHMGKLDSRSAQELAAMGFGNTFSSRPRGRYHVEDRVNTGKLEYLTARLARFASDFSGQSSGQATLEVSAGLAMNQMMITEMIETGTLKISELRRAAAGWSEADVAAITAQMKIHVDTDAHGIHHANIDKWTNIEAASKYRSGIQIVANRIIQRGDRTQLPLWMSHPVGKLLMQLRTFSVQSTYNKLLFDVRAHDVQALKNMVLASAFAAVGYASAVYIRSALMPDAKKYRDEKLTWEQVAKAAFSRSAYSGVVPSLIDTGTNIFGFPEVFSGARNTNLQGSIITGNPTYAWARAAAGLPLALRHAIDPNQHLTQQDYKNIADGLWIPRAIGVSGALQRLLQNVPKEEKIRGY